jgi:hypothetical protein
LMFLAKHAIIFKECLTGLSPVALCRIQFNLNNSNSNVKFDIHFDAIKYVASNSQGHGVHETFTNVHFPLRA